MPDHDAVHARRFVAVIASLLAAGVVGGSPAEKSDGRSTKSPSGASKVRRARGQVKSTGRPNRRLGAARAPGARRSGSDTAASRRRVSAHRPWREPRRAPRPFRHGRERGTASGATSRGFVVSPCSSWRSVMRVCRAWAGATSASTSSSVISGFLITGWLLGRRPRVGARAVWRLLRCPGAQDPARRRPDARSHLRCQRGVPESGAGALGRP